MLLWLMACGHPLDFEVGAEFPDKLSELGFESARDVVPFEPTWPLWSNGLDKERWVYVPKGTTVDTSVDPWAFPVGTLFFKTFSAGDEPIETRIMRKLDDEDWEYVGYQWRGEDADRLELEEAVVVQDGDHAIPTEFDCKMCHEPGGGPVGFGPRQLTAEVLEDVDRVFDGLPGLDPVRAADDATTDILGYWVGNCVHCHDGEPGDQHSFDMAPEVAEQNTMNVDTDSGATAAGTRIVPGSPEESILFLAVSGEHDNDEIKAMPPAGVQLLDAEHIEQLRSWIRSR